MKRIRLILKSLPIIAVMMVASALVLILMGRIQRAVEARGEVRVQRYQVVRAQGSGIVTEVMVPPGEPVEADEILLRLEDFTLQRDLTATRQKVEETRARLDKLESEARLLREAIHPLELAKKRGEIERGEIEAAVTASRAEELAIQLAATEEQLARAKQLTEAGLLSEQGLQEAHFDKLELAERNAGSKLEVKLARARLAGLRDELRLLEGEQRRLLSKLDAEAAELRKQLEGWTAQLAQLGRQAEQHQVRATLDGVFVGPPANDLLGRRVEAGEELANVIDTRSIYFVTQVPEEAIVRVRTGQPAHVEIVGLPKQRFDVFSGQVDKISPEPTLERGAVEPTAYPVHIHLEEPWILWEDGRFYLRSGMRGTAKIAYRQNVPVLEAIYDVLVGEGRRHRQRRLEKQHRELATHAPANDQPSSQPRARATM